MSSGAAGTEEVRRAAVSAGQAAAPPPILKAKRNKTQRTLVAASRNRQVSCTARTGCTASLFMSTACFFFSFGSARPALPPLPAPHSFALPLPVSLLALTSPHPPMPPPYCPPSLSRLVEP